VKQIRILWGGAHRISRGWGKEVFPSYGRSRDAWDKTKSCSEDLILQPKL